MVLKGSGNLLIRPLEVSGKVLLFFRVFGVWGFGLSGLGLRVWALSAGKAGCWEGRDED